MGTVVDAVEGNEQFKLGDIPASTGSLSTQLEEDADSVVYKLVRVDGNGRLVPATDDEVMEVEDMLKDDKSEGQNVTDRKQTVECQTIQEDPSERSQHQHSEGQELLEREKLENDVENVNMPPQRAVDSEKTNAEETASKVVPCLSSENGDQSGSGNECSKDYSRLVESETSCPVAGRMPNFSRLKGEICLENLTVKELQETFRAAFGRETSVKDKQWLKRRISMGLSNSCDFSITTFVIQDDIVIRKGKLETSKSVDAAVGPDPVVGSRKESNGSSSNANSENVRQDTNIEERAGKRIRKPTKRYIEELSEVESADSNRKTISSSRNWGDGHPSSKAFLKPIQNAQTYGRPHTRQDSLGGSGVQVPYVSRVRRGRPREDFVALMKFQPNGMGMAMRPLTKAVEMPDNRRQNEVFRSDDENWEVFRSRVSTGSIEQFYLERKTVELERAEEVQNMDSFEDESDDNVATVPTSKGGMRRKHHRPWTLTEVTKLVEGVARFGAGRWSEIKRLAFASISYRTSVDLKDKWRNLLRASFSQLPDERGAIQNPQNPRKHTSIPIPSSVLLRVRELADTQGLAPPNLSSGKHGGNSVSGTDSSKTLNETKAGFL